MSLPESISKFLSAQSCLTICSGNAVEIHCASCFYAFDEENNLLLIKSSAHTRHITLALQSGKVAGTVLPDRLQKGKVNGVQFKGNFSAAVKNENSAPLKKYYLRYPFALAMPGEIWQISLTQVKMTDYTLGFGKKIIWPGE